MPRGQRAQGEGRLERLGAYPGHPWGRTYEARKPIKGSPDWQIVSVSLADLIATKKDDPSKQKSSPPSLSTSLPSWDTATELSFGWAQSYVQDGQKVKFGSENMQQNGWREPREFRNLRWEGGAEAAAGVVPDSTASPAPAELDATIQTEIKKSL